MFDFVVVVCLSGGDDCGNSIKFLEKDIPLPSIF